MDPLKLSTLLEEIQYDDELTNELVYGFLYGFNVGYQGPLEALFFDNHLTARNRPEVVQTKLDKEIEHRRFCRLFNQLPLPDMIINPLGLVPKTTDDGRDLPSLYPNDPDSY